MRYGEPLLTLAAASIRRRTLDRKSWFHRLGVNRQPTRALRTPSRRLPLRPITGA